MPAATQEPSNRYTADEGWSVDLAGVWKVVDRHNIADLEKVAATTGWSPSEKDQILAPVRAGKACMFWPATPALAKGDLRGCWIKIGGDAARLPHAALRSKEFQQEQWKALQERLVESAVDAQLLSTEVVPIDGVLSLCFNALVRKGASHRVHFLFIPRGKETVLAQASVPVGQMERAGPHVDPLLHSFRGAKRTPMPETNPFWNITLPVILIVAAVTGMVLLWWQRRRRAIHPEPEA